MLVLSLIFGICLSGKCQSNKKPYSVSIAAGFMYNDHYEELLFRPGLCTENCEIQKRGSLNGLTLEVLFSWTFVRGHHLVMGYALLERGIQETVIDARGQTQHIESSWDYNALQVAYRLDIISNKKTSLYLQNGLALEFLMGTPDFGTNLAQESWAVFSELGLERQLTKNAAVYIAPQFRTSLSNYNTTKYNEASGDYRPYAIAGKLGIRFSL